MLPLSRRPSAIILDWDNTLIDSWECIQTAFNETLKTMGHLPWTVDQMRTDIRYSLRDRFPLLFGDQWKVAQQIYYTIYGESSLGMIKPIEGAEILLKTLSKASIYRCVVSNKQGDVLRAEADYLGWTDWFGQLIGAGDAEFDKPSVGPVNLALEPLLLRAGMFDPEAVWFVGDTGIDMECAHAAGCLPVLIGSCTDESLEIYPPRLHVSDCYALSALIDSVSA